MPLRLEDHLRDLPDRPLAPPSPRHVFRDLLHLVEANRIELLIPVTDITTTLVSENKASLQERCAVPVPEIEAIHLVYDKARLLGVAKGLGVACPRTHLVEEKSQHEQPIRDMTFPAVVKPHRSRICTGNQAAGVTVAEVPATIMQSQRATSRWQ